jgi:hypothetical protein
VLTGKVEAALRALIQGRPDPEHRARVFEEAFNRAAREELKRRVMGSVLAEGGGTALNMTPLFDSQSSGESRRQAEVLLGALARAAGSRPEGRPPIGLVVRGAGIDEARAKTEIIIREPSLQTALASGAVVLLAEGDPRAGVYFREGRVAAERLKERLSPSGLLRLYMFEEADLVPGAPHSDILLLPFSRVLADDMRDAIDRLVFLSVNA